jgi:methyltransferase (TIGR00027 family)
MVDHVCLRTAAIDAALTQAVHDGCRQLVVLGAGLDGRAWRLESLREVDVYEVDHPDTQTDKRRRVEALELRSASISFVAVDFARDRLTDALAAAGHDANHRTFWIWEGVTPYLPQPAIAATLADIASRSASGSALAMTYVVPGLVLLEGSAARAVARVTQTAFRALGEPLLGATDPAWMAERLEAVGFRVDWDEDARGWTRHGPGNATLSYPFRAERLVIATRGRGGRGG